MHRCPSRDAGSRARQERKADVWEIHAPVEPESSLFYIDRCVQVPVVGLAASYLPQCVQNPQHSHGDAQPHTMVPTVHRSNHDSIRAISVRK